MPNSNTMLSDDNVDVFPSKTERRQRSPIFNIFLKLTINRFSPLKEIGDINIRKEEVSIIICK